MSLKVKAIKGVKWTGVSAILLALFQLIQIVILSRFISPSDFGIMAIIMVVIGFSSLFMDMGISSALIHKKFVTTKILSSLYALNIFSGVIVFFIIYIISPYISLFYGEDDLTRLIRIISVTFIISAIGNQYKIIYQKELLFDKIAKIEIFSSFTAFLVAVILAYNNFGVSSLVFSYLTNVSMSNFLLVISSNKDMRPKIRFRVYEVKPFFSFGMFQVGERAINYFNAQFDTILIGRLLGAEYLGIYTVAKTFVMKPAQIINPILTKVTFPIMAKVQDNDFKLKSIYLKTISYLCSINFPIYIGIFILANPIIIILFGEKWVASIIILKILSLYFMLRSIANPIGSLLLAKGKASYGFYWNLVLLMIIPLSIYVGSQYDLIGISISLLCLQFILIYPAWRYMINRLCKIKLSEYFWTILKPLIMSVIAALIAILCGSFFDDYIFSSVVFILVSIYIYMLLIRKYNEELWLLVRNK